MMAEFPPHPLGSYAFIGDGQRGALIGPAGDVVWMCAPSWHSDAVFASLVGGSGIYAVTPTSTFTWGGYYEPSSLIWRSRWITRAGVIECREALALPADPQRLTLLRRIESLDIPQRVDIEFSPVHGFGREAMTDLQRHGHIWTARLGPLRVRWQGPTPIRRTRQRPGLTSTAVVEPGRPLDLVLEIAERPLEDLPPRADELWAATQNAWSEDASSFAEALDPVRCRFDHAILRGLTSATGAMVAAATMSLPERAEQGRNYDYRYAWIRDQAYAGQAAAAAGATALLESLAAWISARLDEHGPKLAPAYTIDGHSIPEPRDLGLAGYPGGFDIVGNEVKHQFQLDAFGESLLLLAAAVEADVATTDTIRAAQTAASAIEDRWREPDAGIWEIDSHQWTHSRLTCVAGLRRMSQALGQHDASRAAKWNALADEITADTARVCVHPSGRWQRNPQDPKVDAALLLPALRGGVAPDDPRTAATLNAVLDDLVEDGFAYRFRHGDLPLAKAEGSFVLCGFLVAMALHQQRRPVDAALWFERTGCCTGPPGIYAEEWDTHEHQLRGNLPQAFVHALHLEAAVRLARARP
jgi:hypothetical protein